MLVTFCRCSREPLEPPSAHQHFKMRILTGKILHRDPAFPKLFDLLTDPFVTWQLLKLNETHVSNFLKSPPGRVHFCRLYKCLVKDGAVDVRRWHPTGFF